FAGCSGSPTRFAGQFGGNVNISGTLTKTGGSFVQPHPTDPSKELNYRFFEGPEDAIFERGTARLVNGTATIDMPEHFRIVAAEEGIRVQLTPLSADSKGLAVVSKSREKIVVKELLGGSGTYELDYFVTAVRAGFEGHEPIQRNLHFKPSMWPSIEIFEEWVNQTGSREAGAVKKLYISNGLLTPEGKLNRAKVLELGWTLPPETVEVSQPGDPAKK
ncbi:MAG: hypothetical protein ACYS47_18445, partial [Planctomycetota bacterium]